VYRYKSTNQLKLYLLKH